MRFPLLCLIACLGFVGACMPAAPRYNYLLQPELDAGRRFDSSRVGYLQEGGTTREEVSDWLGEPFIIERVGPHEVWYYYFRVVRERISEDWARSWAGDVSRETIEERAATLSFVGDVLHRIDTRTIPNFADDEWVRASSTAPTPEVEIFGPGGRPASARSPMLDARPHGSRR